MRVRRAAFWAGTEDDAAITRAYCPWDKRRLYWYKFPEEFHARGGKMLWSIGISSVRVKAAIEALCETC
jgi:hypothetical protein